MNPQWNTPPNGDFASYVERLSAQAALPRRAPEEGEHALDVGMTPASESPGTAAASALRRSMQSNGAPAAAPGVADVMRRLAGSAARRLRAWAEEAARQQAAQKQQTGRKK